MILPDSYSALLRSEKSNPAIMAFAKDFKASMLEIDSLVTESLALGALGAGLKGGGFGGWAVHFLVETEMGNCCENLLNTCAGTRPVSQCLLRLRHVRLA